jgi:hypothetical protein
VYRRGDPIPDFLGCCSLTAPLFGGPSLAILG